MAPLTIYYVQHRPHSKAGNQASEVESEIAAIFHEFNLNREEGNLKNAFRKTRVL